MFSDPHLDDLYRYFQAGSVAAYEHTAMIKLHYSLVDIMDECIQRLEVDQVKKRKRVRPRTQILMPESKERATIVIADSRNFSKGPLTQSPMHSLNKPTADDHFNYDNDDLEDEYERNWLLHDRIY